MMMKKLIIGLLTVGLVTGCAAGAYPRVQEDYASMSPAKARIRMDIEACRVESNYGGYIPLLFGVGIAIADQVKENYEQCLI